MHEDGQIGVTEECVPGYAFFVNFPGCFHKRKMENYLVRNRVFLGKNIFISGVKLSLSIK